MFFMRFSSTFALRWQLRSTNMTSSDSCPSFDIIFCPVVCSPSSFHHFFKVFFHKCQLTFCFGSFFLATRPFSFLAISFFFKILNNSAITINPLVLGGESSSSICSPFHAFRALLAASWTWIILCLAACCKASGILNSNSFYFSDWGKSLPIFSMILQMLTLHMYALRFVVFVFCIYLVPSMTATILARKVTSFPSKKERPWDSIIPKTAWNN